MRYFLLVLACLAVSACPTAPAKCQSGCLSSAGTCLPGTTNDACGGDGVECVSCTSMHASCITRGCVASPDGGGPGGGAGGGSGDAGGGIGVDAGGGGSGADAGRTTWPDGGSLSRFWDGGACAVQTDCPCFSSDDCGPGFFCHSLDSTGANVFCVPGARGAGLAGDPCTGEADCLSALCIEPSSGPKKCSALCDVASECPASLPRCLYVGFGVDRSLCSP